MDSFLLSGPIRYLLVNPKINTSLLLQWGYFAQLFIPQEVYIHRNVVEGKWELPRSSSLGPGSEHLHGHPSRFACSWTSLWIWLSLNLFSFPVCTLGTMVIMHFLHGSLDKLHAELLSTTLASLKALISVSCELSLPWSCLGLWRKQSPTRNTGRCFRCGSVVLNLKSASAIPS